MKKLLVCASLLVPAITAHAEYETVHLTVFGMDCAPCAHAIHVSMKGIQGVDKVDVDLNTGLVTIALKTGNTASMQQFNAAVEKNGFTHKDASITARGRISGTAAAPYLEVSGTGDRYALVADHSSADIASLLGKTVTVSGKLPQAAKGKVPDKLAYDAIAEAK